MTWTEHQPRAAKRHGGPALQARQGSPLTVQPERNRRNVRLKAHRRRAGLPAPTLSFGWADRERALGHAACPIRRRGVFAQRASRLVLDAKRRTS